MRLPKCCCGSMFMRVPGLFLPVNRRETQSLPGIQRRAAFGSVALVRCLFSSRECRLDLVIRQHLWALLEGMIMTSGAVTPSPGHALFL